MRKILTALVALVSLMSTVPLVTPAATPASVTANVDVLTWCDIAATGPIDFSPPSLIPGQVSSEKTTSVSEPIGNKEGVAVTVQGNDWDTQSSFLVGQTHWALSTFTYGMSDNILTSSPVSLVGTIGPGTPQTVHLQVKIPNGQSVGTYHQTITFTACGD